MIYSDNQSAIQLVKKNLKYHKWTKHKILLHLWEVGDEVQVELWYVHTRNQSECADWLTKLVPKDMFHKFRNYMGMGRHWNWWSFDLEIVKEPKLMVH
jgi:hypothetical protein